MRQKNSLSKEIINTSFWLAKSFLLIFVFGSSVFASSSEISVSEEVINEKKDISVFVDRLSDRLKGVFQEIISLSAGQPLSNVTSQEVTPGLFDVQEHIYRSEIVALANLGIIDPSREKFYPDNYLRRYELVIMMVKYRLAKENNQLSPVVLPLRGWFYDVAQNTSYAPYVAYADEQGLITQMIVEKEGKKFFFPNKFLSKKEVCGILNLDISHTFCTEDNIKRGEFAALLFRGFRTFEDVAVSNETSSTQQKIENPLIGQLKTMFVLASK